MNAQQIEMVELLVYTVYVAAGADINAKVHKNMPVRPEVSCLGPRLMCLVCSASKLPCCKIWFGAKDNDVYRYHVVVVFMYEHSLQLGAVPMIDMI